MAPTIFGVASFDKSAAAKLTSAKPSSGARACHVTDKTSVHFASVHFLLFQKHLFLIKIKSWTSSFFIRVVGFRYSDV
jgi:hypothetical protein